MSAKLENTPTVSVPVPRAVREIKARFSNEDFDMMKDLVDKLDGYCANKDDIALERSLERLQYVLDQYQEQPHLLDGRLDDLLKMFFDKISEAKTAANGDLMSRQAYRYLCHLTKVRGAKIVTRHLSHEVRDLEPLLASLESETPYGYDNWERRYMNLVWLALLSKIPFDLRRFETGSDSIPVVTRILAIAKPYLEYSNKCQQAAGMVISAVLTRPDTTDTCRVEIAELVERVGKLVSKAVPHPVTGELTMTVEEQRKCCGVMSCLAALFKHGKREDLLPCCDLVLGAIIETEILTQSQNTLLRKLCIKLSQRVCLIHLRPRIAVWRYQRGLRSISDTLKPGQAGGSGGGDSSLVADSGPVVAGGLGSDDITNQLQNVALGDGAGPAMAAIVAEDDEEDVPEVVESILDFVLRSLRDRETFVRWSAAKGLGRIVARLPRSFADQVVDWLLTLFEAGESDGSWHGGCLALAELARRGYLLPERLEIIVPLVIRALFYDEVKGSYSVGSQVRDAACYVCWAFARSYRPDDLAPYVPRLACGLVTEAVFDREVNCRRAASAAFQENVGRQGTYSHGIEILTMIDYFAVRNRTECYETLAVSIGRQYPEYARDLVENLIIHKVGHWDEEIRLLAARGLSRICQIAPQMVVYEADVPSRLLKMFHDVELFPRQGALLALGHCVNALGQIVSQSGLEDDELGDYLDPTVIDKIISIPESIIALDLLKSIGGDLMRFAVNQFFELISSTPGVPLSPETLRKWLSVLMENLCSLDERIRTSAGEALTPVLSRLVEASSESDIKSEMTLMIEDMRSKLAGLKHEHHRMGMALALGSIPTSALQSRDQMTSLISTLIGHAQTQDPKDKLWAESRRDCIKALGLLVDRMPIAFDPVDTRRIYLSNEDLTAIWNAYMLGMEDYTIDRRGDIGTVVREASMAAMCSYWLKIHKSNPSFISDDQAMTAVCKLLQKASEKIDRTRVTAANVLTALAHAQPAIANFPHPEQLRESFREDFFGNLEDEGSMLKNVDPVETYANNWAAPWFAFPRLAPLLGNPDFTYHVTLGFIVSAGDLTESTMKYASDSFLNFVAEIQDCMPRLDMILSAIIDICNAHYRQRRVGLPLLRLLDMLLSSGYLEDYTGEDRGYMTKLFKLTRKELFKCKNVDKLMAGVAVYCGLLQFEGGDLVERALKELMAMLLSPYPRVRKCVSEQLYQALLTYGSVTLDNHSEQVMSLLDGVDWLGPEDQLQPVVDDISRMLKIV